MDRAIEFFCHHWQNILDNLAVILVSAFLGGIIGWVSAHTMRGKIRSLQDDTREIRKLVSEDRVWTRSTEEERDKIRRDETRQATGDGTSVGSVATGGLRKIKADESGENS